MISMSMSMAPEASHSHAAAAKKKTTLACHRCREKRARCSGDKPQCLACQKSKSDCIYPTSRKRKRTRREMNEAEGLIKETRDETQSPTASASTSADMDLDALFQSILASNGTSDEQTKLQAANLVRNLDSQFAIMSDDPAKPDNLELYYYRISGSTAINPGINRISLKLQARHQPSPSPQAITAEEAAVPQVLFDDNGNVLPSIYEPLLDTFFNTLGQHFPSVNRRRVNERLQTGTMSSFLLMCICAVSNRFATGSIKSCTPFVSKAQQLVVDLLHLPAHDVVTGLQLLAWANYGQKSESGFWQYSGMAIRMALDMGLHKNSELYESPAHVVRTRLLFWSLFITDRILSFVTGRPASIPEDIIEIPLPIEDDLETRNHPFTYVVQLMVICGRISNCLNGRRGKARTLISMPDNTPHMLQDLQTQLAQFYNTIPDSMKWSVEAFKEQESTGTGGIFLFLHLWANAVLAQTYQSELSGISSGQDTPAFKDLSRSVKMALTSSRIISECLVFADLLSSFSYCASPGLVQPIYVAGLAYALEMKTSEYSIGSKSPTAANTFLMSINRQNLSALLKALHRMEQYWAGVSYVSEVLEQRVSGLNLARDHSKGPFIALPDNGILRRYTATRLPHQTAPATESSLQEAIRENAQSEHFTLEDLLSSYTVEDLLVGPANSFDIATLMASG